MAHRFTFLQLCSQFRSGRRAHTFSLIKSMQKSRQNKASTHNPTHGPLFCQATAPGCLLNIILILGYCSGCSSGNDKGKMHQGLFSLRANHRTVNQPCPLHLLQTFRVKPLSLMRLPGVHFYLICYGFSLFSSQAFSLLVSSWLVLCGGSSPAFFSHLVSLVQWLVCLCHSPHAV